MPTLYVIGCAAPPVLNIQTLITRAIDRGWDTCLILTSTADRWLADSKRALIELTGHPVRTDYKLPGQPDLLPPADAMLVAPTTSNTINKWAAGISDTLPLGLITEGIGKGFPLVALPFLNEAQAKHPAFSRSVETLRGAGVQVLLDGEGYTPHGLGGGSGADFPWDLALDRLEPATKSR
ncbi:flavoprotein [Nocardia sp. BMG51109]|uniref:flavoprotein n=1 Tax=Nocardia sp. BMG51109 TaxID=1056816 RepID=UPI001E3E1EF0|nr:flavoprotein [Nocardia sp. BMG51109]